MNIRFVEEAQQEFLDAISFYGEARAGLGRRFTEQVDRSVLWIAAHPELYRLRAGGYVRINLRIFPYYLPYIVRGQTLWVLAVAHGGRQPNYRIARRPELSWPRNPWRPQRPARGFTDPSAPLIAALHRGTITLNVMTSASYTFLRTIFSALVCIFLSAVSVSHAQNLLTNPGFEGTGTGSTTGWNAGGGTISASAAQKRSGFYSGLDANRTATWNSIYRNLLPLVSPGKSYRYLVWVRLGAGAEATTSLVIAKTDGGPRSYTTLKSAFVTSTGWNQLSGIFTYSPRGTATELIACGDDAKMVIDEVTVDLAVQGSPITQKASGFLHGLGDMQPSQAHYEPLKPRIQRFPAFLGSPNMLGAPSGFSAPGYMNRLKAVGARQQIVLSDEYMWFGHHQA